MFECDCDDKGNLTNISDGEMFSPSEYVVSGIGPLGWKPETGDVALCTKSDSGVLWVLGVNRATPDIGLQIGDNENGIRVLDDGTIVIDNGANQLKISEDSISLAIAKLLLTGIGISLEASVDDSIPPENKLEFSFTDKLKRVTTISLTSDPTISIKINNGVKDTYQVSIGSDGKAIIKPELIQIGDSGDQPALLGAKHVEYLIELLDALVKHTHGTGTGPSSPVLSAEQVKMNELLSELRSGLRSLSVRVKLTD